MISISSAIRSEMVWSKTPHRCGYELTYNREIVGSLQRMSFWSSEFRAESAHGSWKFRRTGCFRIGTEIIDSQSSTRIALFKPNLSGGGMLQFSDGLALRITSQGFWRPVWSVLAESAQPVMRIHSRQKTMELLGEWNLPEDRLTLVAIFAWHIMRQASEDAAASVAATVAVIS
jgi:hypothetical protein